MFSDLQLEIADRILSAQKFFHGARRLRDGQARATAKGLMFVELYGVYEYTVTGSVREAIVEIKSRAMPINKIRLELLGMVLDSEVRALLDAGRQTAWDRRLKLFQRVNSSDTLDTPDDTFPDDGSHFRVKQLQTIWALFGISKPIVPHGRLFPLIGELVGNRNAIAHGRSTALEVGRRYSTMDIASKISRTRRLCTHIARTLASHCLRTKNLGR